MNMKQKMDDLKEVLRIEENMHHSKWLAQVRSSSGVLIF